MDSGLGTSHQRLDDGDEEGRVQCDEGESSTAPCDATTPPVPGQDNSRPHFTKYYESDTSTTCGAG